MKRDYSRDLKHCHNELQRNTRESNDDEKRHQREISRLNQQLETQRTENEKLKVQKTMLERDATALRRQITWQKSSVVQVS